MRVILAGGFLGAGKTTLLYESAKRLARQDRRVGLITNDQAPELVDSALLSQSGAAVREVAGSCFCCNFNGFLRALQSLEDAGADHVIAEPVGSCTDLSATIMQPLKDLFPAWRVAPLSVLIDPRRVHSALRTKHPRLHEDATYILKTQLREADQIVLTKADLLAAPEREELLAYLAGEFPGARPTHLSALTGEGVDTWLESVLEDTTGGLRITAVDYERYAQGEAVLGWLNAAADLRWIGGLQADWEEFAASFFELLQRSFVAAATEVGHIKLLVASPGGRLLANLTSLEGPMKLQVEGGLDRLTARMTANVRVQMSPQQLEQVFRSALRQAAYGRVAATMKAFHCLSPGRPVPTHRYGAVV